MARKRSEHVMVWTDDGVKQALESLAQSRQLSLSALLRAAFDELLGRSPDTGSFAPIPPPMPPGIGDVARTPGQLSLRELVEQAQREKSV